MAISNRSEEGKGVQRCLPFPMDEREAFGHYISGFVDGEGTFGLRLQQSPKARFVIALRADDHGIIKDIHAYFGCGVIRSRFRCNKSSKPQMEYVVNRAEDLMLTIVSHFERYCLRAKKARDFAIWKQGVSLIWEVYNRKRRVLPGPGGAGVRGTCPKWAPEDWAKFRELSVALKSQREYRQPPVV